MCFICACTGGMYEAIPRCNCLLEQTHAVYSVACIVSDSYIASYSLTFYCDFYNSKKVAYPQFFTSSLQV